MNYLLATDLASFPSPSAHHVHKLLLLLASLRSKGIFLPPLAKLGAEPSI